MSLRTATERKAGARQIVTLHSLDKLRDMGQRTTRDVQRAVRIRQRLVGPVRPSLPRRQKSRRSLEVLG